MTNTRNKKVKKISSILLAGITFSQLTHDGEGTHTFATLNLSVKM